MALEEAGPSSAARCRRSSASRRGPATPSVRHREAEDALLGHAHAVDALVAEGEDGARALVEQQVAAHERRGGSRHSHSAPSPPPVSSSTTHDDEQVAARRAPARRARAPAAAVTSAAVWDFMSCAPRPHSSPSTHVARPRVALPLGRVGEHGVDVREQAQRRARRRAPRRRATRFGRSSVRPSSSHLEARVAQQAGEQLLGRALVAGRVDRVEAHEALEQLGRLALEVFGHRPQATRRPDARGPPARAGGCGA